MPNTNYILFATDILYNVFSQLFILHFRPSHFNKTTLKFERLAQFLLAKCSNFQVMPNQVTFPSILNRFHFCLLGAEYAMLNTTSHPLKDANHSAFQYR